MEVALYMRVSTSRQQQPQTIEQQRSRLRENVAAPPDWYVADEHVYRDDGYSGATLKRPGLDRLRGRAAMAAFACVLMTAPDRHVNVVPNPPTITHPQQRKACFVLGTTIADTALTDAEVIAGSKGQSAVEGGFRFLKDLVFFVSSLFVKKPSRLQGLLMVMTLALLVYAVAQRQMRPPLAQQHETLPNQIGPPTSRPTRRWVFQLLEGIHRVTFPCKGMSQ